MRGQRAVTALVVIAIGVVAGGCGLKTASPHEVRLSVEQLQSIAAEGSLMAQDLADGRTKTTFVRVHGEELSAQAEHEAEKLNDGPLDPSSEGEAQHAIDLASQIGSAIDDLRVSPQDRAGGADAAGRLRSYARQASRLADRL